MSEIKYNIIETSHEDLKESENLLIENYKNIGNVQKALDFTNANSKANIGINAAYSLLKRNELLKNQGRKQKLFKEDLPFILKLFNNGWSKGQIAKAFDVSRTTIHNVILNPNKLSRVHKKKKYSSKYRGVSYITRSKKWKAQIMINGENKYLGSYATEKQAHEVYLKVLNRLNDGDA